MKVTLSKKISVFGLGHRCIRPNDAAWSNFVAILKRGLTQVLNFKIKYEHWVIHLCKPCNVAKKYNTCLLDYTDIFGLRTSPHPPSWVFFPFDHMLTCFGYSSYLLCCVSLQSLSTQQLVYLAIQIVKAVQFLHRKKILHKDIATRNCV